MRFLVLLGVSVSALSTTGRVAAGELFRRGLVNGDATASLSDALYTFEYLFSGGPPPTCLDAADTNDDGRVDLSDGIHLLNFLFVGGRALPPPAPGDACPGADPTADDLGCESGEDPSEFPPDVDLFAVVAPAPGIRQRSRTLLPRNDAGAHVVREGTSFALLVQARGNFDTLSEFTLEDPEKPRAGDPATLRVRADRDLGDPARGGATAGTNLARHFLRDIDPWEFFIWLREHVTLRIAGDGPLGPTPGTYRFTASVTDDRCGISRETELILEVEPSGDPEIFVWVEEGNAAPGDGPLEHDPGSGNARLTPGSAYRLVVEGLPNGRGGPPPDLGTLTVVADPPFPGGADLGPLFSAVDGSATRLAMELSPPWLPIGGNTTLAVSLSAPGDRSRTVSFELEVPVAYASDIQPIWDADCNGCHCGLTEFAGLSIVFDPLDPDLSRRHLVNVFASQPEFGSIADLLVRPYRPRESYLVHKLRGTQLEVGGDREQMPQDGPPYLEESDIHLIESWIRQGAP